MIVYEKHPMSATEASLLKSWMSQPGASIFREAVTAQMNQHYLDALNYQTKLADSPEDKAKFSGQAASKVDEAKDIVNFIKVFERFADPEHGFFRLKINT